MRSLLLGLALWAGACGRLEFGDAAGGTDAAGDDAEGGDDGADSDGGGTGGGFDPVRSNCAAANAGPAVEAGRYTTNDAARGIWVTNGYILVASAYGGFESLSFDGTSFSKIDEITDIGWVETMWTDGTYLYIAAPGTGVTAARLNADGTLDKLGEDRSLAIESRQIWGDGTNIYVPNGGGGLVTLRFDGASFTKIGTVLASQAWSEGGWWDGTYHYFADGNATRILSWDGNAFTERTEINMFGGYVRVWPAGGNRLLTSHNGGLTMFRYDGSNVAVVDSETAGPTGTFFVWSDGVHAFVTGGGDGTYAYDLAGNQIVELDVFNADGDNLQVMGDGTYLYVAGMTSQVIAYRGFECTQLQ